MCFMFEELRSMYVVYFDQLLGAACTQKMVETLYSAVFTLFYFLMVFNKFSSEIKEKTFEKTCVLSYSLKLVDMQKLVDSLRGYLEFIVFWLIYQLFWTFDGFRTIPSMLFMKNKFTSSLGCKRSILLLTRNRLKQYFSSFSSFFFHFHFIFQIYLFFA